MTLKIKTTSGTKTVSIFKKHGSPYYYARFWHENKKYECSLKTTAIAIAKEFAKKKVLDALEVQTDSETFQAYFDVFINLKTEGETQDFYRKKLKKFLASHGPTKAGIFTRKQATREIQDYLDRRRGEVQASTVAIEHRALRAFFGWIHKTRNIWEDNPALSKYIDLPKKTKKAKTPLTQDELFRFWETCQLLKKEVYLPALLCFNGVRPTHAINATWGKIDFKKATITTTEKSETEIRPIASQIFAILRKHKGRPSERIFPFNDYAAHRQVRAIRKAAGLGDHVTLNNIRASAEFILWQQGESPQMAAKLMGHSVTVSQKNYVDFRNLEAEKAANRLRVVRPKIKSNASKKKA